MIMTKTPNEHMLAHTSFNASNIRVHTSNIRVHTNNARVTYREIVTIATLLNLWVYLSCEETTSFLMKSFWTCLKYYRQNGNEILQMDPNEPKYVEKELRPFIIFYIEETPCLHRAQCLDCHSMRSFCSSQIIIVWLHSALLLAGNRWFI